MDVEGGELAAINGAISLFSKPQAPQIMDADVDACLFAPGDPEALSGGWHHSYKAARRYPVRANRLSRRCERDSVLKS